MLLYGLFCVMIATVKVQQGHPDTANIGDIILLRPQYYRCTIHTTGRWLAAQQLQFQLNDQYVLCDIDGGLWLCGISTPQQLGHAGALCQLSLTVGARFTTRLLFGLKEVTTIDPLKIHCKVIILTLNAKLTCKSTVNFKSISCGYLLMLHNSYINHCEPLAQVQ